jgi:hypothetical protein
MNLNEQDKQWIKDVVEGSETRLLGHMDDHFRSLEMSIGRHDKGILAANVGVNAVTGEQAKYDVLLRDLLRRVEALERKADAKG